VMQAVVQLLAGRTLILVTHKLQLLSFVDRVTVIDNGVRVADGPRQAVMQALTDGRVRSGQAEARP
jgi:ATP-binding cassette, subfamily C, bacterial LapB